MRASVLLPVLALALRATALPPACLLHAVNTADNPADMAAVCGDEAGGVQQAIFDLCEQHEDTAQQAFIDTCSVAGTQVAAFTPTSSASTSASTSSATGNGTFVYTTASFNSDCSCTVTAVVTQSTPDSTAVATGLATTTASSGATGTASGSSSETGAAVPVKQLGSGFAAMVALAGVVAAF